MRGYRFFFAVIGPPPPPTAVCNFLVLVDLPRALQQFGSAPEIPVRNPPPPSECTNPPPPSESWIRAWAEPYRYMARGGGGGVGAHLPLWLPEGAFRGFSRPLVD